MYIIASRHVAVAVGTSNQACKVYANIGVLNHNEMLVKGIHSNATCHPCSSTNNYVVKHDGSVERGE